MDAISAVSTRDRKTAAFDVEIAAVATAVPEHAIAQAEVERRSRRFYPQFAHMAALYANTGVGTRYFCMPEEWYEAPRSWEERTEVFQQHALDLLERVASDAVSRAGLRIDQIDAVVTNTITGLAIPSLDAMLMNRMRFAQHTERLPTFGLGCGGGVAGFARATRLAQTMPGGNVLFLTIDLCSLCMRVNDPAIAMYVALALFGDGAAGVVLRNTQRAGETGQALGQVVAMGEHFWPGTEHIMGWDITNDGFGIVLSPELPALIRDNFVPAVDSFLARNDMSRADLDGYLLHPGGSKIVDIAEAALGASPDALEPTRRTLRDYGNMSSATALFVLDRALASGRKGRHLLAAFGPGFSAYFVVLDL